MKSITPTSMWTPTRIHFVFALGVVCSHVSLFIVSDACARSQRSLGAIAGAWAAAMLVFLADMTAIALYCIVPSRRGRTFAANCLAISLGGVFAPGVILGDVINQPAYFSVTALVNALRIIFFHEIVATRPRHNVAATTTDSSLPLRPDDEIIDAEPLTDNSDDDNDDYDEQSADEIFDAPTLTRLRSTSPSPHHRLIGTVESQPKIKNT